MASSWPLAGKGLANSWRAAGERLASGWRAAGERLVCSSLQRRRGQLQGKQQANELRLQAARKQLCHAPGTPVRAHCKLVPNRALVGNWELG